MRNRVNKLPVIGITIDLPNSNDYAKYPWYAVRCNYADAVVATGGVPVFLPMIPELIDLYIKMIDGLLITGGDFDINPSYYGEEIKHSNVHPNQKRTEFEAAILKQALALKKPILGICGGMQLINVIMGGSLIQDIEEETGITIHQQVEPKHILTHSIIVTKATKLHQIMQVETAMVNSSHHQAVRRLGMGVLASVYANDNIVEAIELSDYEFCIGVQWHPEYLSAQNDKAIFQAFIKAAKAYSEAL